EARMATALEYLGPAAARATGGAWSAVALEAEDGQTLRIHVGARGRAALEKAGIESLSIDAPALREAWERRRPLGSIDREDWGEGLRALGAVVNARAALVAPLVANRHRYGLFVVLVERASPFVDDDLAVLEVLADQAAVAIDVRQLIEDNERERP